MPRLKQPVPPVSREEVHLATDPTRWELLAEAAGQGPFAATRALKIARQSPTFRGGDTAARDQADRLVDGGVLKRRRAGGRVGYRASAKGKAIYARLLQLEHARPLRTPTEPRLLALIAQLGEDSLDLFESEPGEVFELVAELRGRVDEVARLRRRLAVFSD